MSRLDQLKREITDLHRRLNFRPTLLDLVEAGRKLTEMKSLVPHGRWGPTLREMGVAVRCAQLYSFAFKHTNQDSLLALPKHLTFTSLLTAIRKVKKAARRAECAAFARSALRGRDRQQDAYRLATADCRTFRWPDTVNHVATDPPWDDLASYRWLAGFAQKRLRAGGTLFLQLGHAKVVEVANLMEAAGLTYRWCAAIVYHQMSRLKVYPPFTSSWRPVLVFSRSAWNQKGLQIACDTQSVFKQRPDDYLCENQQPLVPWQKWMAALTRPGDLVADPFAGVATIGVALKSVGGRRYLGTERDERRARLGRGRLAKIKEGSYRP
jgi:hypothetical protein